MRINLMISSIALLLILIAILLSPDKYVYDEVIFINNIHLLHDLGFGSEFIYNLRDQSPGPLYQLLHAFFTPVTHLEPVKMRLLNYVFFLFLLLFTYYYFRFYWNKNYANMALMYVFVPMSWVVAGMALTEIPSMMFLSLSVLLLGILIKQDKSPLQNFVMAAAAGICLGLSILGRTQFLMLLLFSTYLFLIRNKRLYVLIYILSALAFPVWIFSIWKGIVPPDVQNIQQGFNIVYLFLSLGYLSLMTLFVCYKWFFLPRTYYIISSVFFLLFLLLNLNFHLVEFEMLRSVVDKIPLSFFKNNYKYIAPSFLLGISAVYVSSCVYFIMKNKNDHWVIFLIVAGLLIVGTTIKSAAQFSSRYVVQSLPLFILAYSEKIVIDKWSTILGILGALLGMASLYTYYY